MSVLRMKDKVRKWKSNTQHSGDRSKTDSEANSSDEEIKMHSATVI